MDMHLDSRDDDFDDLQETQDRPLLVWLLMASGTLDFATLAALLAFGG
jgi:hypothetical protein